MNPHSKGGPRRQAIPLRSWCQFVAEPRPELAGYVPRYFAALAEAAAGGTAGGTVPPGTPGLAERPGCRHGFPHHAADAATMRAGELCLAAGALTGSLRRLLADQLEDLRRSVAVRSAV